MEHDRFISEGISRYGDAVETIRYFREKMRDAMDKVITQKKNWGPFTPGLEEISRRVDSTLAPYIYVQIPGGIGNQKDGSKVELGVWWNAPGIDHAVVLYARIRVGEGWLPVEKLSSSLRSVKPIEIEGTGYLVCVPDKDCQVEQLFAGLLDEIVKQVSVE